MARVTYLLQRYDEALSHSDNAVQTSITSGSDWMLADALVTRANIEIALGDLDQASTTLDEALAADTTNVAARIARARIQARRGDISAAVTTMARAESFEENPDRLLEMGILYYDMRVDERAVEALTRGLERAPNDESMLYYLAATRMRSGQRDIAIELASNLIARNPAMLSAYVIRGRGELLRGYLDRARADVDRVLSQVPTHYDALVLSGDLYVAEGMPTQNGALLDAAEQAFLAASAAQPQGFEAIDHLADLHYARRNTEAFIALVEPRLRDGMTNPNWRIRLAESYQSVGRVADGIALRSELALAAPSDVDLNMTVARMALDNPGSLSTELVVRHASAAYQHSNRSLEFILLIVDAHLLEGNCEQALNRLETAINAHPTANSVRERQARIEACD
jgi:tetratricopeptide (TPR) repeat protein